MAKNTNNWYLSLLQDRYPDYTDGAFNQQQDQNIGRSPARQFAPPNPVARRPQQQPNVLNELMAAKAGMAGSAGSGVPPGTNPANIGALLGGLFPRPVQPGVPTGGDADAQEGGFYGQMPEPPDNWELFGTQPDQSMQAPPEYRYFDQDNYG